MNIMHLSRAEYKTLSTTGTLTKNGVTYTFDPINTEYVVPDGKFLHTVVGNLEVSASNDPSGTFWILNYSATPIATADAFKANASKIIGFSAVGNNGVLTKYAENSTSYRQGIEDSMETTIATGYGDIVYAAITDTVTTI